MWSLRAFMIFPFPVRHHSVCSHTTVPTNTWLPPELSEHTPTYSQLTVFPITISLAWNVLLPDTYFIHILGAFLKIFLVEAILDPLI